MRRMFSVATPLQMVRNDDVALEAYREADFRQAEFFGFLDKELQKIEAFYKMKEDEATKRLKVLREQLHILRDRRAEEIVAGKKQGQAHDATHAEGTAPLPTLSRPQTKDENSGDGDGRPQTRHRRAHPFAASVDIAQDALTKVRTGHVGKTSKAMEQLGTPRTPFDLQDREPRHRDYTRRDAAKQDVPYRTAKRKLKIALAEFYRALELLKSYSLLNRTAFRKINKKFDKTVNANPTNRYMSDNVNTAHFVKSDVLDGHIQAVEDLYARYFERGSHKLAVGKLRARMDKPGAFTGAVFRTGLLVAFGLVLSLQAIVLASLQLDHDKVRYSPSHRVHTEYLLQIYGGYFLMLLLVGFFVVDAGIFTRYRVNYQFIFEFDTRHTLDWKELAEMPAWFFALFGLVMWVNFSSFGGGTM